MARRLPSLRMGGWIVVLVIMRYCQTLTENILLEMPYGKYLRNYVIRSPPQNNGAQKTIRVTCHKVSGPAHLRLVYLSYRIPQTPLSLITGGKASMDKGRLEAFSDGVIAIIITIMVLTLIPPHEATWQALLTLAPLFLSYVLSFVLVGIYWNNHHHLLQAAEHVSGRVLWANMHLLFWLSLFPFATEWMGETHFAPLPVAVYGAAQFMAAVAYYILTRALIAVHPTDSVLVTALGNVLTGQISAFLLLASIPLAFLSVWLSGAIFLIIVAIWLVPDSRFERRLS
jgi:uncharacterized membrane protein